MKKVFWDNPYETNLETTIKTTNGNEVVFAETIAYSFAGGQESDYATVNNIPIISSRIEGSLIYYTLPENHGFKKNDTVIMQIDWERRYKLMRLHFAAELILELVTQQLQLEKIGAHIAPTKTRIDFISPSSISQYLPILLEAYNTIINNNLPIQKGYSDIATQRRFWKIEGFAQVPCGGTHVNSTGEVGFVSLKREHPGKSIERIEIRLIN